MNVIFSLNPWYSELVSSNDPLRFLVPRRIVHDNAIPLPFGKRVVSKEFLERLDYGPVVEPMGPAYPELSCGRRHIAAVGGLVSARERHHPRLGVE